MFNARRTPGRAIALPWVLALILALCTGAGLATAAPRTLGFGGAAPVIDGNGDDIISFVAGLDATSCAVDRTDNRDDIVIADPKIIVCADQEDTDGDNVDDYFVNGFDVRRFVLVYDRPNKNLYVLFRQEGLIGDVDGNGNPDNNLCAVTPSFGDQPGIGSQENYQVRIDTNCDGLPDVEVKVGGVGTDQISVTGASTGATSLAYRAGVGSGKDLEILVSNIDLPPVFRVSANANASFDGLGEDITATATCGAPAPSIDLTKSVNVPVICPGGTADFTMVVTNTGNVDLTNVSLVDNLPAGLTYTSTVSNTCGGAVNAVGNQITYGPFNLAVGASCTIVLRVGRTAECAGQQVNNASVEGQFQSACFNGGEPTIVGDKASASVLCGNVVCSIDAPDLRVCPGETVEICGPVGEYSYAWSNGATTRCITVGAGTYSLVVTEIASGCVSTNPCSVTVVEDPRPVCEISAPDTRVCPGETVEICGPEGNYSYAWNTGATTRCITVGAGTYSLVITDLATGCVSNNSCSVTIVEDPRPVCEISAPDTRVCPGETVEICGPEGNYSYAWNTGATTRCITVGAGTYSLVITDLATGCVSNNSCSVTIVEDPRPVCEISAPDTRVCPGETVEICGPEGNYSYAWNTGATTRCITVGAGTYSLVITDLATGCVSNNSCSVTIVEDPRPVCEISAPDTRVCPGETVEICGPEGNYSYAWNTGATTRCITVGAGTYSLVITDLATGCVSNNSCSVTIVEDPRPTCSIEANDTQVCPGETVEICGPVGNYSYAWNTGATTRCITVGVGTYSLVITDLATGCVSNNDCQVTIVENPRPNCEITARSLAVCPGETTEICGPVGNYSYAWSTGATTRCITVGAGTFTLTITDLGSGCISDNSCSITIVESPRPTCEISAPDTRVCPGETVEICGPEGNYSYAWNTGATTRCITVGAGTYSLVITDLATGCVSNNSCSVTIVEDPRPTCSIEANDTQVCPGETVEICGPVGNYSYAWSTGATTRCITVGAGTYSLVITDLATGCVSNNSCSVTIVENPRPVCEITGVLEVCPDAQTQLCGPVGNYSYLWNTGATTRCITVGVGTYSLEITDLATGCKSSNPCTATVVEVGARPCVEVVVNAPEKSCVGASIQICGTVKNCSAGPETIVVRLGDETLPAFENVPAGETREFCFTRVMPACEGGAAVRWVVTARATSSCGEIEQSGDDVTACAAPEIDVEKTAEAEVVDGAVIHYEITVRNPSADVTLENITVTDELCEYVRYKGNATPAPFSEPIVDTQGGTIVWKIASLAPGASTVLRFEAQAWLTGANIACPAEVTCTNHVAVVGYCAGSGTASSVRDEDTADTKIVCRVVENCPRTVGFWSAQCAQKRGGSTKFDRAQMDQITACVDASSSFFNWANDFDSFCSVINPSGKMDQRKQAKRQFAGVLANMCTDQLDLTPNNGAQLLLSPSTPINCGGFAARTIGELVVEIDALLAELEGQSLNDEAVKSKYGRIISCADGINNGVNIPTTSTCEHGGTSESTTGTSVEPVSIDALGIELYRPFPNPFSATTQFAFEVEQAEGANVDVTVYDVSGRQIRKLVTGVQPSGRSITSWDGRNDAGVTVTRGVYFVRTVIAGEKAPVQRLLFVR